jgi:hypothetical protein
VDRPGVAVERATDRVGDSSLSGDRVRRQGCGCSELPNLAVSVVHAHELAAIAARSAAGLDRGSGMGVAAMN